MKWNILRMQGGLEKQLYPITGEVSAEQQYDPGVVLAPETKPVVAAKQHEAQGNVEYFDMGKISFVNNSIIADLIRMVRNALKQGKELRFLNVPSTLAAAIRKLGLSDFIKFC